MFYNARWFDPQLGRFAQADIIIPSGVQGLDRYAYVRNSPLNYTDPSGHNPECGPDGIWCSNNFEEAYGITFEGDWTARNKAAARIAVKSVAARFALTMKVKNSAMAFAMVFQTGVTFAWVDSYTDHQGNVYHSGAITKSSKRIEFASMPEPIGERTPEMAFTSTRNNVVHELGHVFASLWFKKRGGYDPAGPYANIPGDGEFLSNEGFYPSPTSANRTCRQHPCSAGDYACPNEVFADMFLGWTFGKWGDGNIGARRQGFMATNMTEWVTAAARR